MKRTPDLAALLLAAAALGLGPAAADEATYYVGARTAGGACSDQAPGTSPDAPWCTIGRANRSLQAGDTVVIAAGEYRETIAPERSGTEGRPITYRGADPEGLGPRPVLDGVGTGVLLVGRCHVVVDGIDVERVDRYVTLDDSHHVTIRRCGFRAHNNPIGWPTGILFKNNSHHNVLADCDVGRVGYSTADDDKGCVMNLGVWENNQDHSDHNLIVGNVFHHGGHHVLAISSNRNVVRGNLFHNENWMDCERAETRRLCGNRNIIFEYEAGNVAWNVIEDNWLERSGLPPDQNTSAGMSVRTPHNIVRRNVFVDNDGPGLDISTLTGLWDARDNHVYHNLMVHNGYTALPDVEHWKQAGLLVAHHGQGAQIVDLAIKNNVLFDNKAHGMMFYYVDRQAQQVQGNWDEAGDPGLRETPAAWAGAGGRPDIGRHAPRDDSPCVDGGVFLTTALADGAGTQLPVADAGYFSDGREMVEGDLVQLEGSTARARILAVDYDRNVLTLDQSLAWSSGQGVSQPYDGRAPDIGAVELWSREPTPGPSPSATAGTVAARIGLPIAWARRAGSGH